MEYTFSADVAPFVGAMGEAIAAAKRFESAVHDARDAELELGASGGDAAAGLAAQTAAMDAAAQGGGMSKLTGIVGTLGTPAMWAGIAGLAAGAVPAVLSLGAGFLSFGAMAYPALSKVKSGLTAVTQAQKTYQAAKLMEQRDPTKANLAAEQRDLQKLQNTWAAMPKPVRGAVSEIRQFGRAWHEASVKSGLQKAA